MKLRHGGLPFLALMALAGTARADVPQVVASIAPIHSLTAAVMAGIGEAELLVPANVSDHDYAMRPSDVRKIAEADLVVWVGPQLETYLEKAILTEGVPALALLGAAGVEPRPYRAGAAATDHAEELHQHDHADEETALDQNAAESHSDGAGHVHDHTGLDPHVWLDPVRAQVIVRAIADQLADVDPENAETYRRNAASAAAELKQLDAELRQQLVPVAEKPFITFHDGYGYFVERYGLNLVGQLGVQPEQQAGAASVRRLQETVAAKGVACAFAEPQFGADVVEDIAGDANIKLGTLDAIGADLDLGAALYGELLRRNAAAIVTCLASTS